MKPSSITATVGIILIGVGIFILVKPISHGGIVPILVGGSLMYLAFGGGRIATLVFGHTCVVVGAYMITWGILLLPYSEPKMAHIFGRPLFWGIFSLMGGICAIFHGFCRCVIKQADEFEGNQKVRTGTKEK
jgi:uncharacterized membrane protein HdeD (DUF308 family)